MEAKAGQTALFEAKGVSKLFGSFAANDDVSLTVRRGEKHALLGENGAGKSTLVKMMYGVLQPTSGQFFWCGEQVTIPRPAAAREMGIGMVFQHFSVFEALSVAENIALALPPQSMRRLSRSIAEISEAYGLAIDPDRAVHTLSVGEKQRVEIIRCLLQSPRLLIMDEPTSVLTPQEADDLFATLEKLAADGCAILYISHKLDEVKALCETATILRHGKLVAHCDPAEKTAREMAELMVGNQIAWVERDDAGEGGLAEKTRLHVQGLTLPAETEFGVDLQDITLRVHRHEVVGIAGIAGEGQAELMQALIGERRAPDREVIEIDGVPHGWSGPSARRRAGAAFVPEERHGHAAVSDLTLGENVLLTHHASPDAAPWGWIDTDHTSNWTTKIRETFDVRSAGTDPVAGSLSGGNLQKFVIGRELLREPGVLVVSQPTWGVDAGSAATIRRALVDLAASGAAVLVISQDLEELFSISDSIAVMHGGRLSRAYRINGLTPEKVGLLMSGADSLEDAV
ncbi:MAG: ABC transporter ATP-binding protein [Pseudomonadota bacterium]